MWQKPIYRSSAKHCYKTISINVNDGKYKLQAKSLLLDYIFVVLHLWQLMQLRGSKSKKILVSNEISF